MSKAMKYRLPYRMLLSGGIGLIAVLAACPIAYAAPHAPAAAASERQAEPRPTDPLHGWTGSAESFTTWVSDRLGDADRQIALLKRAQGPRTVANTLVPYDAARNALALAENQAQLLQSAGSTQALRNVAQVQSKLVGEHKTKLDLDRSVYDAIASLSDSPQLRAEDSATREYVAQILHRGRLAGVDRDAATRARVQMLRDRIESLRLDFARNAQDSKLTVRTSHAELKGLPSDYLASHPPGADGSVVLTSSQADAQPVLRYAHDAALRRRMLLALENRAYPANDAVLKNLLAARHELATTLGFRSYAALDVSGKMIGSIDRLRKLLDEVEATAKPVATREAKAVSDFAKATDAGVDAITAADWTYWSERYGQSRYDFDTQSIRPYLPFERVQQGILDVAGKMFKLRFAPVTDAVVWHPSVKTFDVYKTGAATSSAKLGRIYLDMHPRAGKFQWFGTAPVTPGSTGTQLPEAVFLGNFRGGDKGDPGLLSPGDVVTFLHEFGHILHHLLGGQGRWSGQGGFDVQQDFLEAPSQMLESVARVPSVFQALSHHYQTGEKAPIDLIKKMNAANVFGRAHWLQSQLARSAFALELYDADPSAIDINQVSLTARRRYLPFDPVLGTHDYASSAHIADYASSYYMYVLDKVIALDMFDQFDRRDPFSGTTPDRYRRAVLEPGATRSAEKLVADFLGREPSVKVLEAWMTQGE